MVARLLARDILRLEGGMLLGGADEGFGILDLGAEARLCSRCRIAPFVNAGGGFLTEPEYTGLFGRVGGGIVLRVSSADAVRAGFQRATHDGESGPHLFYVGYVRRWGERR
jgi:hypothetical protein